MRLIPTALISLVVATACVAQTSPTAPAGGAPSQPATGTFSTGPKPDSGMPSQQAPAPAKAGPVAALVAPATEGAPGGQDPGGAPVQDTLRGKVENGRYYSPTKSFDIAIPTLVGDRPVILDNPDIVVFRDDVRTLVSIAAIEMQPFDKWELETTSSRDFLIKFFRENVLSDYADSFPGTTIESARLVPDLEGGALMVNTLHPNGSGFRVDPIVANDPGTPPPVAKRGNLLFCHGNHVFVISSELADRVTEMSTYTTDKDTEDRILRDRLIDVHDQMHFNDDAPAAGPTTTAAAATPSP